MPSVKVNGTELYYERAGAGPALLFVHGMCGFGGVWRDQMDRLSAHFRCVTYDRRGHGRSPLGQVEQRTVELHADDAAALIETLDLAPCVLVGSSGGARIGLDVVRRYPHLLAAAVHSEPPALALDPEGAGHFITALKPLLEQAGATGGPRAAVDAFFSYVCPGLWQTIDDARREPYRANAPELLGDLQMPPYRVTAEDLRRVTVPVLILRGDKSLPVFRGIAGVVAANVPGAEMVELAGSGHVTYAEQPAAFARAVVDFAVRLHLPDSSRPASPALVTR